MELLKRIEQYKQDELNLFSYTEKIMAALIDPLVFNALMPEQFKTDIKAGYYELDQEQRTIVDNTMVSYQITGKTLRMIQELRIKSKEDRTIPEAIQDCVYICHEFFDEIKSNVLIDAKYPTIKENETK